jgi:glucose uptake protein GlcU
MTGNTTVGIAGVCLASVFWGSCYTVVKGYSMPSDGIHFAFLMSIGILFMGILSLFSSSMEEGDFQAVFSPCGLLGGFLWACGNFLTVPIIECVGLGIGLAIWAGVNMIVAFVVGAMGMEGIGIPLPKEPLTHPACGVFGVLFAMGALCIFANIKKAEPATNTEQEEDHAENLAPLSGPDVSESPLLEHFEMASSQDVENLNVTNNALHDNNGISGNVTLGVTMAIAAGVFYGFQMVPLSIWNAKVNKNGHIFDHPLPSDTIRALRFFFSQFAGIFLTALMGFIGYCFYTNNRPKLVPPKATLPAIVCGAVWAVGCAGAMFATSELGNSVGFPLVLNCSFLINSAWSILVFKEIQGTRNLKLFGGAFLLNSISSLLISASKA